MSPEKYEKLHEAITTLNQLLLEFYNDDIYVTLRLNESTNVPTVSAEVKISE